MFVSGSICVKIFVKIISRQGNRSKSKHSICAKIIRVKTNVKVYRNEAVDERTSNIL